MRATASLVAALIAVLAGTGCGEEDEPASSPDPATERNDPPAKPPPGWRTFSNRRAGFTLSVPRGWPARVRRSATLIRSSDRLLAVTVAADRGETARTTVPREYARRTFAALPGFRDVTVTNARKVKNSPYASARLDGVATLAKRRQRRGISVAAFRRRGLATYTVVAFSAPLGGAPAHTDELDRMLASLRARRPAG